MKNAYNGQRYVKIGLQRVLSSVSKFVLNCFGMRSTTLKVTRSGTVKQALTDFKSASDNLAAFGIKLKEDIFEVDYFKLNNSILSKIH